MSRIVRDRHFILSNGYSVMVQPAKYCKKHWAVYAGNNCYGPFIASGDAEIGVECRKVAQAALDEYLKNNR